MKNGAMNADFWLTGSLPRPLWMQPIERASAGDANPGDANPGDANPGRTGCAAT